MVFLICNNCERVLSWYAFHVLKRGYFGSGVVTTDQGHDGSTTCRVLQLHMRSALIVTDKVSADSVVTRLHSFLHRTFRLSQTSFSQCLTRLSSNAFLSYFTCIGRKSLAKTATPTNKVFYDPERQTCLQPQSLRLKTLAKLPQTSRSKCYKRHHTRDLEKEHSPLLSSPSLGHLGTSASLLMTQQAAPGRHLHFQHWAEQKAPRCAHCSIQDNLRASWLHDDKRQTRGIDQQGS